MGFHTLAGLPHRVGVSSHHSELREATIVFDKQTKVCLPTNRNQGKDVLSLALLKFTQRSKAVGKLLTQFVTHNSEFDFVVRDTGKSGILVGAPQKSPVPLFNILQQLPTYVTPWFYVCGDNLCAACHTGETPRR